MANGTTDSATPIREKLLRGLKLGNIQLDFPVVQAALSGYSDWPMRVIAKRLGAPYTICEVMLDKFLVEIKDERKKNKHFLHISDEEHPVGGQLMGAEPEQFSRGSTTGKGRIRHHRYQLRLPLSLIHI